MDEPLSNLDAKLRVQMRTAIAKLQQRLGTTTVYVTHDQTEAMTLGDRVAVLRRGEVQQVGSPRELYNSPNNLFVAGFIGSPAMNFQPAELDGDTVHLPMADVQMPDELRQRLGDRSRSGNVLAGIRPEHFEDASLIGDDLHDRGATFSAEIDVIEWMGSELYAYFTVEGEATGELADLAADLEHADFGGAGGGRTQVVARLDSSSEAKEQSSIELWLDARRLHLFDPDTGENLTRGDTEPSHEAEPAPA